MPLSETRELLRRRLGGNVPGPPANRFVIPIHAAARVVRHPAGLILEQTDSANAPVSAKIEPVQRASRYANQIACFHFDGNNSTLLRVNMKQPAPSDDVAHFVFVMGMLDVELREHRVQPGRIRINIYHIRSYEPATPFEFLNLTAERCQDLLCRSIDGKVGGKLPPL